MYELFVFAFILRALLLNIPGLSLLLLLTSCCGLVMYAHYKDCDPMANQDVQARDQVSRNEQGSEICGKDYLALNSLHYSHSNISQLTYSTLMVNAVLLETGV